MEEADDPHPGHKLCGYLSTILTIPSLQGPTIPPFSPCHIIADKHNVGFETQDGIILCPISNPRQQGESSQNGDVPSSGGRSSRKRRFTGIGIVNGSLSVVHQIHALVMNKCIKVTACVLHVEAGDCEVRVVVMVDVYLPVELWSGWQFPKLGSVAGAFFKHLSCNWEERRATLGGSHWYPENVGEGNRGIWTSPDCHVYGCKAHHSVQDSSRTKDFELHEIFKNLPGFAHKLKSNSSRLQQAESSSESGIWDITDDILINILSALGPKDLVNVNKTCRHLRNLVASVVPCMKLKLFPHQQAAVEWMLQRERNPQVLRHPLYMDFATEDGLVFYIDVVTGEFVTGLAPTVRDFCGGMFCDEPGLGKTVTALSLILKTQGTIANPPELTEVIWCNVAQNCGYYELSSDKLAHDSTVLGKRIASPSSSSGQLSCDQTTPISNKRMRFRAVRTQVGPKTRARNLSCKKNLLTVYGGPSGSVVTTKKRKSGKDYSVDNETWVQCDACLKWRRLDQAITVVTGAWFCSMNSDPKHRSCRDPEEDWDKCESVTHLPGFFTKGTRGKKEHNVSFFVGVLKEHSQLMSSYTRKALTWLADLSENELRAMETVGLPGPLVGVGSVNGVGDSYGYHKIFQAFGFLKCIEKGVCKWYYPRTLDNLEFDLAALNVAMHKPLDSIRFYLSRATLIIVPANLVDHWTTQIQKHVKSDQLRVCIWTDLKKPSAHSLAWDYDIVITTFNRLSAEWSASKKSPLMQVHWFRVLLDEGHTLGSSLSLTNKLHMAISLRASSRWLLTGTPTPNTPDSQLSHLHPMLHFLHEECYGLNQKSWEAGILKPFEAEMEEGRTRLLQLLHRCLISAKKVDMKIIPPCIKKITFLNFSKEHARSYNELVVTVRRNILMADWNDPSHIESLLNPKQWKFRSSTIRNVRLSCCVAGNIKLSVIDEDIQETMEILHEKGLDPTWNEYSFIRYCLEFGGKCFRCNEWCRLPIITPCWHLLCLECVSLNSEKCTFPGCGKLYEMQAPEILTRPENPNPKWPVPKDLIELQPSYKQDDWNPDWEFTSSSKVAYLVERLKALKVSDRDHGYFVLEHDNEKINEQLGPTHISNETVSNKVIIFSQFLEHIHIIEKQLHFAGINYASLHSPMHSFKKMKALNEFQLDDNCMALIMDGSAALGLDFSFVSHVFLMEPIWDRSMEEQVISRAHRMGATRPIHVETLAMRGTIEEQMLKFLEDPDQCRRILTESKDEGGRAHRSLHDFAEANYLAHLSFVHESSST